MSAAVISGVTELAACPTGPEVPAGTLLYKGMENGTGDVL